MLKRLATPLLGLLVAAIAGACASHGEPAGPPRQETVYAVTERGELVKFNAGQPQRLLARLPLQGLAAGERLVGIDFRVARGVLYGLSTEGRLYTLDTATGRASRVGNSAPVAIKGQRFGVDFNPVADRIRVVSDDGQNLRVHPDTGMMAAIDPPLHYGAGDPRQSSATRVLAAAYTYNKDNDKLTTNYAIDQAAGTLVMQGTKEGVQPAVSPNTGWLRTVGPLGTGPVEDAAFDIADINNAALAALRRQGRTQLHLIDLETGRARPLGTIGDGAPVRGLAIEP